MTDPSEIRPGEKSAQAARLVALHKRLSRGVDAIGDDDLRALEVAAVLLERMSAAGGIEVSLVSIVSRTTGDGMVDVAWGETVTQLSIGKAREIAWMFIEAASAAQTDAMLSRYLTVDLGVKPEAAQAALTAFRRYRDEASGDSLGGTPLSKPDPGKPS